jgi:N-acetyl-gamma-glutamyl-phosphate reductase
MSKLRVAICGGSGYTGSELLRLLLRHPKVEITAVTSERSAGKSPADLFPHLYECAHLEYVPLERQKLLEVADLFFMALPHGSSQEAVNYFFRKGRKIIDLSADFRLRNHLIYEQWYKVHHKFTKTLQKAVYGLPEIYKREIRKASLVANPGCYPTGALLALYPMIKNGFADTRSIIIDSKSGMTGAGRKADVGLSFSEVNQAFRAYGVGVHRHTPEIEQEISRVAKKPIVINFTPHLLPVSRGILTTIYVRLGRRGEIERIHEAYLNFYKSEPFVRVLEPGTFPDIRNVCGTNMCEIGFTINERTSTLVIITAIDNLVKGASGMAVQNMNIMMGFREKTALEATALVP